MKPAQHEIPFEYRGRAWVAQVSPTRFFAGSYEPDPGDLPDPTWWISTEDPPRRSLEGPRFEGQHLENRDAAIALFRECIDRDSDP